MDELITIIKSLDGSPTKQDIQEMITEADIDGNGRVDFQEFMHIMEIKMKVRNANLTCFMHF